MRKWAVLLLVGVILGTLLLNVAMGFKGTALIEQVKYYHRLIQVQFETSFMTFLRISIYRIGIALILSACIRLTENYSILYPLVVLMGVAFGYTLSLLTFCYGISGILCMIAYLFPQYMVYVPLTITILNSVSSKTGGSFRPDIQRSIVLFLIILIGCVMESYLNPLFLKVILKRFF
ncbi:hypothetical protein [Frisingicoccus sp.]|uniref:hypothetical protein n=1 Tax=Frisingicoccus sp. TaxID=1918627 RepID=UPI002EC8EB59|nr:hypothetical protein [Frisingicoccus sp.]